MPVLLKGGVATAGPEEQQMPSSSPWLPKTILILVHFAPPSLRARPLVSCTIYMVASGELKPKSTPRVIFIAFEA